jgi:hypothetical protein
MASWPLVYTTQMDERSRRKLFSGMGQDAFPGGIPQMEFGRDGWFAGIPKRFEQVTGNPFTDDAADN